MSHCINKSSKEFKELVINTGMSPVILAAEVSVWQDENGLDAFPTAEDILEKEFNSKPFVFMHNTSALRLSDDKIREIYDNYVKLMDRKREGKAISLDSFKKSILPSMQVFKAKDTYIFGEWDSKNGLLKGRLMSSPNIRQLFDSLDILLDNVSFMASVPGDIGAMLEKKGMYKLDVGKHYDFRGEEMTKNLYFSDKELAEKTFDKPVEQITTEDVEKYDEFYNYWGLIKKLTEAYDNKDYKKIFPLLKSIGIYDYNAYKLSRQFINKELTEDDLKDIKQTILKNAELNKLNIDKSDLLNNPEIYKELDNELNKTLAMYLSKFGIGTEVMEDIQNELGIDSMATVDILNKMIYVDKNNQTDYPQQAGKMIAYMMQHNPLVQEIAAQLKKKRVLEKENPMTQDEALTTVGNMISEELHKRTGTAIPADLLSKIKQIIKDFFNLLSQSRMKRINKNIGIIADNIIMQNQSLITASPFKPGDKKRSPLTKVRLQEALDKDKRANDVVEKMADYFILTGSVTLSEQGNVLRPEENQVHDLDWKSPYNNERTRKIFDELFPDNEHFRTIVDEEDPTGGTRTESWIVPQPGYKVANLQMSKGSRSRIISYDLVDSKGEVVSTYNGASDSHNNPEVEAKIIDIFTFETQPEEYTPIPKTLESGTVLRMSDWRDTFRAKLAYGRLKDIWDYNRFIPYEKPLRAPRDISQAEDVMYQLSGETIPSSTASEDLVKTMKEAATKMGINIMGLVEYAKGNPNVNVKDVNGVADLMKKTIGIAENMEGVAITEEIVHIATAMVEQTHPKLITELISKIDRFKIYKQVYDEYSKLKAYQLENGKPDIRKIKKEAVDKLIAELIMNQHDLNNAQYPELLEEEKVSWIKKIWRDILDVISGMYRKSNIDVYQKVGEIVASGELDASITPSENGLYHQQQADTPVGKFYDLVKSFDDKLELIQADEVKKIARHYLFNGVKVAKSVTEKIKEKMGKKFNRTEEQKFFDDMKRDWGLKGHKLIEDFFELLVDKNGYKRDKPLPDNVKSDLPPEVEHRVKEYIFNLVNSYKEPGTRFLVENMIVNTRVKGNLAGTVDLIVMEPFKNKKGEQDFKVDVLDWKFTSLEGKNKEDIPWYKKEEWNQQMGEYVQALYNYGLKPSQLRKARMIPFIMKYEYRIKDTPKSGLVPKSIETGALDPTEETELYLLPVPINSEVTGNPEIDKLVRSLREQYQKLYKSTVPPEEKDVKDHELNEINKAIRNLQLKLNFEPLIQVGKDFFERASKNMDEIDKIDFNTTSPEQLKKTLSELLSYVSSGSKYASVDEIYLSQYDREGLTDAQKNIVKDLGLLSNYSKRMSKRVHGILQEVVLSIASKEGMVIATDEELENTGNILAEIPVSSIAKNLEEAGRLDAGLIRLTAYLMKLASKETNIKYVEQMEEYRNMLIPLEKVAASRGVKAFDMIATVSPEGLKLKRKFDPKFWEALKNAKSKGNKDFILQNIDQAKFKELADAAVKQQALYLDKVPWSSDPEQNDKIRKDKVIAAANSIDIFREDFNGFEDFKFNKILNQVLKEEGNLSKEYNEMKKTPEALKVWEYFTMLNSEAKNMGYLSKNHSSSFFPLVEATVLQKFVNSDDFFGQMAQTVKDLALTTIDENQKLGMIDPETLEVKKEIPKHFTQTNKDVSQMSTDLAKVGSLWIKSLLEYKKVENLESTLLAIKLVEENKGSIAVDKNGEIIKEGGIVQIKAENPNAAILQTIIDDFAYGVKEDLSSIGNIVISKGVGSVVKKEETKQKTVVGLKKLIDNIHVYIQAMGVGLKPAIGIGNYAGGHLHAGINAGTFYNYGSFLKHSARVIKPDSLTTLEKALMLKIVPNEGELMTDEQRKIAKEKGIAAMAATWSFSDVMMLTNSFGERRLDLANALSFIENSMIVDGKIVPIRQYLKKQDRDKKYEPGFTESDRRALEDSLDSRVNALRESSSLLKTCKIENGKLIIPGVSEKEIAKFALLTTEFGRGITAKMNSSDKAGYKRDTLVNSFMMFKHWIPQLVTQRGRDLQKNAVSGEWEYGRTRVFLKTIQHLGFKALTGLRDITAGNEAGLKILDEMLQEKKDEYFRKTGKELTISEKEFYDTMRTAITNQVKELICLVGLLMMVFAISFLRPPEDASPLEKNRFKALYKVSHKILDELAFYYNPTSFEAMTRGSIIPAASIVARVWNFFSAVTKEGYGYATDDQEMIDKAYPIKYFLNLWPGLYQIETQVIPYIFPEHSKDLGYRVTEDSHRR